ncbi:MAG TPA: hypothetical protein VFA43_04085 [Gemmatimonadaceae bacterium]|nr:hypothetical protein [Gemmatimonadaceae bacterium]
MDHPEKIRRASRLCAEALADAIVAWAAGDEQRTRIMDLTADYWSAQLAFLMAHTREER